MLSVAFSADGTLLAAFQHSGRVKVWAVHTQTLLTDLAVKAQTVFHGVVQFSPRGHLLAIGDGEGRIRFLDLAGGPLPADIQASDLESGEGITRGPHSTPPASRLSRGSFGDRMRLVPFP